VNQDDEISRRLRVIMEESRTAFDRAAQYDNTIIGAGYVGFFALWAGIVRDIPRWAAAGSAALIGISLIAYVIWIILQMLGRHWASVGTNKLLEETNIFAEDFPGRWEQASSEGHARLVKTMRLWYPCFLASLIGGILGGGLLAIVAAAVAIRDLLG